MASDIFSRNVDFGGVFSADGAALTFTSPSGNGEFEAGMLVQNVQYHLSNQNSFLYIVTKLMILC